jgi:cAMP-dependent protein kinase regulator
MENKSYCESKLRDVMETLFLDLVKSNPKDVINFSIDWLMQKGGYTANGLTLDERHELLGLRKEIKKLRELEAEYKRLNNHEFHGADTDEEDDEEEEEEEKSSSQSRLSHIRGPRIAVSAEAYGEYNKKGDFKPVVFPKTEDQANSILSRIIQSFLFNSLDSKELKIIIDAMEIKNFKKGEIIINQGDQGDCLYVVEQGELECHKTFSDGNERLVKRYTEGEAFGELALLYNCPRAAKVVASSEEVILWKLDRETFNVIVKEAAM